jgi:hypothetical protein
MRASSSGLIISPPQLSLINLGHRAPTQVATGQFFQRLAKRCLGDLVGLKI